MLKIVSPDILHKTEANGVLVGLTTPRTVRRATTTIVGNAKAYKSDAEITGVQVQQMLAGGQRCSSARSRTRRSALVGVRPRRHPRRGAASDVTFRLAPADRRTTRERWSTAIRTAEILRGRPRRRAVDTGRARAT